MLIGVHLLIGLHVAHWQLAGRTLAPLELNEVMHTLELGVVTAGFLLMATAVVSVLFFGRFYILRIYVNRALEWAGLEPVF